MVETVRLRADKSILQGEEYFKLTQDTVLLADFAHLKKGERGLDLGAGIGCLAILILLRGDGCMDGLELIPGAAALARENYARCGLEDRGAVAQGDFRALPGDMANRYDVCAANPPYYQDGPAAQSAILAAARNSVSGGLEDVCRAAATALKSGGRFYVCCKPARLAHLFAAMDGCRLTPRVLRPVYHRPGEDAILALVEARYDRSCELQLLPPLVLREGEGYSPEYRRIYAGVL